MNVVNMPVGQLIPYEKNTKIHPPEQIDHIVNSIKRFGWQQPIVIDKNNVVIIGHGRLLAAKQMGLSEVPVVHADELSEEDAQALRLADNKLNESPWDFTKLEEELAQLAIDGIDMSEFGFDVDIGGGITESDITEDEIPEPLTEPIAKRGDIWQLGRHRLMCGDATSKEDVDLLIDGEKIDMVMTDPPYGIDADKMTMGTGKRNFYRGNDWDTERPDVSIALSLSDNVCIWGGNYFADILPISNDWLVWHKNNDGLSFSECELAWTNFGCNIRHISHHWGSEKKLHVTMKPNAVIAWAIETAKEQPNTIADLFGGSGTTLIACEQMNRTCYMMELDPHYCDVIIERWQNLTGETAVLLNADKA